MMMILSGAINREETQKRDERGKNRRKKMMRDEEGGRQGPEWKKKAT